jgi:dTDP-4-dehydrorhamnose 3,5-epimerase
MEPGIWVTEDYFQGQYDQISNVNIEKTKLPGVILVTSREFADERGFFTETYNQRQFTEAGLPADFVQDNHSRSNRGVLRGLHYQYPQWQGKLVRVIRGEIFDVAVDIRSDSPNFGQWVGVTLNADSQQPIYVPPGFAHGFCVMSEFADVVYKCTTLYKSQDDAAIRWDDPQINIDWPLRDPVISEKDSNAPYLSEVNVQ